MESTNIYEQEKGLAVKNSLFTKLPSQAGIIGVAGHRTRGGCRVSLYNGVTLEAVETLILFMKKFAKQHSTSVNQVII